MNKDTIMHWIEIVRKNIDNGDIESARINVKNLQYIAEHLIPIGLLKPIGKFDNTILCTSCRGECGGGDQENGGMCEICNGKGRVPIEPKLKFRKPDIENCRKELPRRKESIEMFNHWVDGKRQVIKCRQPGQSGTYIACNNQNDRVGIWCNKCPLYNGEKITTQNMKGIDITVRKKLQEEYK